VDHLDYLFAGFAVFWAGLFAYLLWLQARLRTVMRQLDRLEERLAESDSVRAASAGAPAADGAPSRPRPGERTATGA
jgi:CcmD family protein